MALSKMIIPIKDDFRETITIDTKKKEITIRKQYLKGDEWTFYDGGEGCFNKILTFYQLKNIFNLLLGRIEINE